MYFIYKLKETSMFGGISPPTHILPDTVELGLGTYEGFYLGQCENEEDVYPIREYIVEYIDDDTAQGFNLLGVNQLPVVGEDGEIGTEDIEYRDLTPQEIGRKNKAYNLILKLKLREKIKANINDIEDVVADLSKRVDLIERLVMRVFHALLQGQSIPQEVVDNYFPFVDNYITSIDNGTAMARIDVEDVNQIFTKLKERFTALTELVKNEYLDQKLDDTIPEETEEPSDEGSSTGSGDSGSSGDGSDGGESTEG